MDCAKITSIAKLIFFSFFLDLECDLLVSPQEVASLCRRCYGGGGVTLMNLHAVHTVINFFPPVTLFGRLLFFSLFSVPSVCWPQL